MKFILGFIMLLSVASVYAADSLTTKVSAQYASIRALGMGDAFTAVADDYSLIFYNPAGFAKKKSNEVQFTFAGAGISPKTLTFANDITKASQTTGSDSDKALAISTVLEEYYGKSLGGKVQALEMFWVRKNWGVALLPVDLVIDMTINRQLGPAIDLNVKADSILAYGYGTEINKFWSAGATAKLTHRVAVEQSVSALELAADSNVLSIKRAKEGNNFDFDIGALWTPNWFNSQLNSETKFETKPESKSDIKVESKPDTKAETELKLEDDKRKPQAETTPTEKVAEPTTEKPTEVAAPAEALEIKPDVKSEDKKILAKVAPIARPKERFPLTLGIVMKNVLGGSFSKSTMVNKDATEAPKNIPRVVDIGAAYSLATFGDIEIRAMVDAKNLLHPSASTTNVLHAGVEFDYSPSGWFKSQLRVGMNQLYYTAGATLLLGVLNIDAVTYGEEVGTASTKIENRVYAVKAGVNF